MCYLFLKCERKNNWKSGILMHCHISGIILRTDKFYKSDLPKPGTHFKDLLRIIFSLLTELCCQNTSQKNSQSMVVLWFIMIRELSFTFSLSPVMKNFTSNISSVTKTGYKRRKTIVWKWKLKWAIQIKYLIILRFTRKNAFIRQEAISWGMNL